MFTMSKKEPSSQAHPKRKYVHVSPPTQPGYETRVPTAWCLPGVWEYGNEARCLPRAWEPENKARVPTAWYLPGAWEPGNEARYLPRKAMNT